MDVLFFKKTKYGLICCLLLCASVKLSYGQFFAQNMQAGISFRYGFIAEHRDNIDHLIKDHISSFELIIAKKTAGSAQWHTDFAFPEYGLLYVFNDFANPKQLGYAYAAIPFISFPLLKADILSFHFRLGIGTAFLTKTYDNETNTKNNVIGTHLNAAYDAFFLLRFFPKKSFSSHIGLGLAHYSNGAWKMPNLGLNIITLNTGISYSINPISKTKLKNAEQKFLPNIEYIFLSNFGLKEMFPVFSGSKPVFSIHAEIFNRFNKKSQWGMGLDLVQNRAMETHYKHNEDKADFLNTSQAGLKGAYALTIAKLRIVLQLGTYLHNKNPEDLAFYNNLSLRYYITDHFLFNISLKSHLARADHIEWGIAYSIPSK